MDTVKLIIDTLAGFGACTAESTKNIRDLDKNIKSLRDAKSRLDSVVKDVKERVGKEGKRYQILHQVENWLAGADSLIKEVNDVLQKGNEEIQNKCLGSCCPKNCVASYRLAEKVVEMIVHVKELTSEGTNFDVISAERPPLPPQIEIPLERTVDMDSKESEVWEWVVDDSVDIIGLCGMGGVGKTTLLKKLYSKLSNNTHNFDVVIWVTVSSEMNPEKIQNVIRNKLEISDDEWKRLDENDRAGEIATKLSSKKFVLLLDDVWGPIELNKVGIPLPNDLNRSKIILTTRFEEACNYSMVVCRVYKVKCLSEEAAWELFRQMVTEDVLNSHPLIPALAKTVAEECEGLPLALVTIGSAMRIRKSPERWRDAIKTLKNYPSKFTGMGDLVFPKLRFSYDSLTVDIHKFCFRYCSIFPEDHKIRKDELIELWIAEGVLDNYYSLDAARRQGHDIIESLILACLLEAVEDCEHHIKMHDILRDLALYLASESDDKMLVYKNEELIKEDGIGEWQKTVRLSLWGAPIKLVHKKRSCPRLITFLARNTDLETFPNNFFQSMHALKVLDLQGNSFLSKLPHEVSKLLKLQYLNLSDSCIEKLPIEVKNLTQLKILLLDGTQQLEVVPKGVISSLSSLQAFSRLSTTYKPLHYHHFWDTILLQELERLEHIEDIGLTLFTPKSVHQLKSSPKLQSCVKRLIVNDSDSLPLDISLSTVNPAGYFQNLHDLYIQNCSVKDLTCLIQVPCLRFVFADSCLLLEEIISGDFGGSSGIEENLILKHLKQLNLRNLPRLKSICRQIMSFPSLEMMYVAKCPNLRKLPLKSVLDSKGNTSTSIIGDEDWWNQLEWEDEDNKHVFSSRFWARNYFNEPSYTYEATICRHRDESGRYEYKVVDLPPYQPSLEASTDACCIL